MFVSCQHTYRRVRVRTQRTFLSSILSSPGPPAATLLSPAVSEGVCYLPVLVPSGVEMRQRCVSLVSQSCNRKKNLTH